ncbi:MAG: GGDEF domain-containing protein [Treponema sp.]|nr:GGDEF domain-containing protein [Treponema sp.]
MEMQKSKKTSIGGSIIAAACIIIYLCALVQGSVRIYLSIEQRGIIAEKEFSQIANIAMNAAAYGFMDDRFIQTMNNALAASSSIEALIITGADGGHAFEKNNGHAITWVNNFPRFKNRLSLSNKDHYRPLPIQDIRNANIKAAASAFDYQEFLIILKQTLLIILIGFAISFFTILIQYLTGKPQKLRGEMIYAGTPGYEHRQETAGTGPKGLYSSRSSIGWEEYTKDRLDSELHRCSSTEKDLTLVLMEFCDINSDSMFRQAAEETVNFFTSRDLLFEYNEYGITVILPGIGLDVAITRAEKFYQRIMEKFPGGFASSSLCIGLSSRSGRLLNADRLIFEASEALRKAKNDRHTSIIAFKSDPDKYRDFIKTHG